MSGFKKTLGGMLPPHRPAADSLIPPPPSQDELRPSRPPRGFRTPAVGEYTPGFGDLPEQAPGWMVRARRLVGALESAIEAGEITLVQMAALERAFAAYEMGGVDDPTIAKVSHLCERAHNAIRERFKVSAPEAYDNCAQVLYAGLPRSVKRHVEYEEVHAIVRNMRQEADTWRAVVDATSQLFRWDIKSREHAAQAIRAALDERRD